MVPEETVYVKTNKYNVLGVTNPCQNKLNGMLSICNKTVLNNVAIFIEKNSKLL
jgi:hypothetical protein